MIEANFESIPQRFTQFTEDEEFAREKGMFSDPKANSRRNHQCIYANLFSSSRSFNYTGVHPFLGNLPHYVCSCDLLKNAQCSCIESPILQFLSNLMSIRLYKVNKLTAAYNSTFELVFGTPTIMSVTRRTVASFEQIAFGGEIDQTSSRFPEQSGLLRFGIHFCADFVLITDSLVMKNEKPAGRSAIAQGSPTPAFMSHRTQFIALILGRYSTNSVNEDYATLFNYLKNNKYSTHVQWMTLESRTENTFYSVPNTETFPIFTDLIHKE